MKDDCKSLPVIVNIEGPGCVEIGNKDWQRKNRLCASGEVTGLGPGVVSLFAMADEGNEVKAVIGLPDSKQTTYRKPYYSFYYASHPKEVVKITVKFGKQVVVNDLEPSDSIFKSSKKK